MVPQALVKSHMCHSASLRYASSLHCINYSFRVSHNNRHAEIAHCSIWHTDTLVTRVVVDCRNRVQDPTPRSGISLRVNTTATSILPDCRVTRPIDVPICPARAGGLLEISDKYSAMAGNGGNQHERAPEHHR